MNKEFGTDIPVSSEVAEHMGQEFVLHLLRELTVKRKTKPINVFSIA